MDVLQDCSGSGNALKTLSNQLMNRPGTLQRPELRPLHPSENFAEEFLHSSRPARPDVFAFPQMKQDLGRIMELPSHSGDWSREFVEAFPNHSAGPILEHHETSAFERAFERASAGPLWASEFQETAGSSSVAWEAEFQNALSSSHKISNLDDEKHWDSEFENYLLQNQDVNDGWSDKFNSAWQGQEVEHVSEDWEADFNPSTPSIMDPDPVTAPISEYVFEKENPFLNHENPLAEGLRILEESGRLTDAALAFEAAVQKDPASSEAWMRLGITQAENEKEDAAIAALHRSVKENPANAQALMALAVSYTNEGMDLQAYTTLKRWMNVEYPTLSAAPDVDLLTEVTNLFLEAARKGPGARRAPQESRIDPDVQIGLGVLFYNSGDYDKAVDCFASALSVRPQDYKLWSRLGATLANSGKSEEAIDAYYKALQLKPSFVRGRYNLGVSCINIGCYKEAVEHFLGALSLHGGVGMANVSNNLWETLRRTFVLMERRDLCDLTQSKDLSHFRQEFEF